MARKEDSAFEITFYESVLRRDPRYAEVVDFKEYENKIQKLLNTYVSSDEVIKINEPVNIFDKEKFEQDRS